MMTNAPLNDLLSNRPNVTTAGIELLAASLADQDVPVHRVDWRPPMPGTEAHLAAVIADPRRADANNLAAQRMLSAGAELVDVRPAAEVLGIEKGQFLHAGPPIDWARASGPLRGALIGAALFEGLDDTPERAELRLASAAGGEGGEGDEGGSTTGSHADTRSPKRDVTRLNPARTGSTTGSHTEAKSPERDGTRLNPACTDSTTELIPCHSRGGVGPMAGVVSPSMWLFEVRDPIHGATSWCSLNEGLGKVLRYGAYGPEVVERLRWMSAVLGPLLQRAVRRHGPVDLKAIIAQMLHMGDEGHNRNRAGTLMLLRELLPDLIESGADTADLAAAVRFVSGNDHFFLNLVMPAGKLASQAAAGIPGSTVVTVMARNGTDFGIQTSGTGDRWFTGPALVPEGLFLGSYGPDDANPDIGDSAITETVGLGGFAMAAAPAIARLVGSTARQALDATRAMYEITVAENPAFAIPVLDFRGTPTGIDVTRVVRTGVLPQINTGMAGRVAGTGQVGAGLVTPPSECFVSALAALAESVPGSPL